MVVFTCNHCGESLQKPKVTKHYQYTCRTQEKSLTCVDCLKDFRFEEYTDHTKCMSEMERYSAKGAIPDHKLINKGEVKQKNWTEFIGKIIDENQHKQHLRTVLQSLRAYSNVPRKRFKFINFVQTNLKNRCTLAHINEVWDLIEGQCNLQAAAFKKSTGENNTSIQTPQKHLKFCYKRTIYDLMKTNKNPKKIELAKLEGQFMDVYRSKMMDRDEMRVRRKFHRNLLKIIPQHSYHIDNGVLIKTP